MSIIIEKASNSDIKTIQEIATITWVNTYSFLPQGQIDYMLDLMYNTKSLQLQMQENHQFFLAKLVDDSTNITLPNSINNIIAFASVSKENANGIFKLNKLYVRPNTQKMGVGKTLLQNVIEYCNQHAATQLQLQVNRGNSAKTFYEKNGFTILYEADFEIGNGYFMNDYVMGLNL